MKKYTLQFATILMLAFISIPVLQSDVYAGKKDLKAQAETLKKECNTLKKNIQRAVLKIEGLGNPEFLATAEELLKDVKGAKKEAKSLIDAPDKKAIKELQKTVLVYEVQGDDLRKRLNDESKPVEEVAAAEIDPLQNKLNNNLVGPLEGFTYRLEVLLDSTADLTGDLHQRALAVKEAHTNLQKEVSDAIDLTDELVLDFETQFYDNIQQVYAALIQDIQAS